MTERAEFLACYDQGKRCYTRCFVVFARARTEEPAEPGRLGLAVTRKNKNAVQRNRIKRVLRECFRLNQADIPAMDIEVTPKHFLRAAEVNLDLAQREILPLLRKLGKSANQQSGPGGIQL